MHVTIPDLSLLDGLCYGSDCLFGSVSYSGITLLSRTFSTLCHEVEAIESRFHALIWSRWLNTSVRVWEGGVSEDGRTCFQWLFGVL